MPFTHILFDQVGAVAVLTLNRPEALNALTFDMMREVQTALELVESDHAIRALIVTGAGRGFCSGQDLKCRAPLDADIVQVYMDSFYQPIADLRRCRVPVVMAINGVAAGAGFSLALAGDILLASRAAKFIQLFSGVGLVPDIGSTYLLPRAIGRTRALRMMMTSEPLPAEQALAWGVVSECFDEADLMPAAHALAAKLAAGATRALAGTRQLVDEGAHQDFERQFRRELEVQQAMRANADAREGVAAFIERRKPVFRGA
ncbi:enoyl-CoA hydratase-related protein [Hydrogenophaga sp. BPS33]|uniref:enoyl-CoA hydratase-related protein n=1 Tax=Hydrogenophaga sp. BPS33 TaxID=2651974 RepID=UPI00132024D2|nr:enoyl-CoA hydratase-related protein [Hydrogenophaga sp. BPS33]QHE87864.1 crotonase [Hydrogenophaga sp. BPS33]